MDLAECLVNILGFTNLQRDVLVNDGYNTARTLVHWS